MAAELGCEATLRKRFERAISQLDLPADSAAIARFVVTVNCGMSVLTGIKATRTELLRILETALQA